MASASTWQLFALRHNSSLFSSRNGFAGMPRPSNLTLPRAKLDYSTIAFARRWDNPDQAVSSSPRKRKKKKKENRDGSLDEDDLDEDAFEALFNQLEEDLKNDEPIGDLDEDIIDEVLAEDEGLADLLKLMASDSDEDESDTRGEIVEQEGTYENVVQEEGQEEPKFKLRGWQLRRLAYALKNGKRKTGIKNLAAEIGVDRAIVLELLRNPPPSLLMMCSALPDNLEENSSTTESEHDVPSISTPENEHVGSPDTEPSAAVPSSPKDAVREKTPIHVLQSGWTARKRLKKVHRETLERVYRRFKRPTNAIVSSIVQVTNLPRKKIVKWFEDRRAEEGLPDKSQHRPYRRSTSDSDSHPAFTQFSNVGNRSTEST